ncbi:acyltransferase [Paenarthrobacter sp. DKR-5]|uniref:acyltransferase family protein n=1 Tax=Paenarthrobacter sp. DKR-5 TaxID=2835535 RepID=UPI001BDD6475|nr:acyltransferase [Paenarthrobacter sp. DKR-5]MBT1001916.1 acyltransferase [Paenarthrobacter sp. DKR-5]
MPRLFGTESSRTSAFGYNPALDGLRALAVGGVVVTHAGLADLGGHHGVTVFFVISGYLITSLLLREIARDGSINLRHFYLRRFARLGPALILAVAASVAWLLATGGQFAAYWAGAVGSLTYTTDLIEAIFGNSAVSTNFSWSWSLSIEEQFYLVWPLALLLLVRLKRFRVAAALLGLGIAGAWASRLLQHLGGATHERMFYAPDSHADALLLGTLLAMVLFRFPHSRALAATARWAGPVGGVGLVLLLIVPAGLPALAAADGDGFGQSALCAAAVVLWVAARPHGMFPRVLSLKPLVFLGKLSYGLYLWNILSVVVFESVSGVHPFSSWLGLLWLAALLTVCYLSWRFVETPLRRRLSPAQQHHRQPAPAARVLEPA